ncbi:UDP-4-amino-4,6-dideoxy-N-acetyl-beta-L-altrosamine transaminase [Methanosarcina sp. 1.H.T.1A.1]|uniref:UDP-4-amino-4, 6-dideoxy-N-acetyl-beta-L-altrosamine transaminase n=1 Tax=Methanosarcina sp. 1.H.T.1A.1 TaxID=1483602 RepID=UPI00064F4427|nr:UDP-4-amino-4,6-dideoxy-N-acetyl-beta-L-altrosamine transaminase [Methanosarcina sp. 1.H.T.1A.1]
MEFIPYGSQWIDDEDINEVINVLKSDWITTGPKLKQFEEGLCNYTGCKHAVGVNSGTSALDIAVGALDLPAGSEVITTPFTFMATSNALLYNNLRPVFADIQKDTRNIDPEAIRSRITPKTKAIIYVDFAGHPCDIEEIREIAEEHDLYLIEDACHALGASYKGKKVGNFADLTVFSFHPVKPITTGEGGAVVTDNSELEEKVRMLQNHGIDRDAVSRYGPDASWAYDMKMLGRNYRLTEIQAALGVSQLKKLDRFIEMRTKIANLYNELLEEIEFIETPSAKNVVVSGWHIYTVLLNGVDRDKFFKYMRENGVGVNVHYIPIYNFTYYRNNFDVCSADFPVTEEVFKRIITLPIFPKMKFSQLQYVIKTIKGFV